MFEAIGDLVDGLMWFALIGVFILLPLAIWKLIDIIIWLCHHIHFTMALT